MPGPRAGHLHDGAPQPLVCGTKSGQGAASILRQYIDEEHGDVWRAIGDYHSHTRWLSTTYKLKVLEQAMQLPQAPAVRKPAHKGRKKDEALAAE